jgi:Uma2 family endonuclease
MTTSALLSLEEYLALPAKEGVSYEYDEGRLIEVPAHNLENAEIQGKVVQLVRNFIDTAGLPFIVAGPTGFWLTPELERIPDVCLIRRDKAAAMEVFHGSRRGAPDLAVEIVSPNENAAELERKIDQYLTAGVAAVVVLYPQSRVVWLYRAGGEAKRLGAGDALEVPVLLPGLRIPIAELFTSRG